MPLTIAQVAFPFAPVGPDAVGGAEQVPSMLDAALARMGHRSIVVACEGSSVSGTLVATPRPRPPLDRVGEEAVHAAHRRAVERAVAIGADIVHMHGLDFHAYLPAPGVPVLVTLHLPPSWYPAEVLRPTRPETWMNPVSWSEHGHCPPSPRLLPPVPNGVPVGALATRVTRRDYALVLGRVCEEKNLHGALDAGTMAGVPVLIGGRVFPYEAHERYFAEQIAPRVAAGPHRFLGPLGFARKRRLLSGARCLVSASTAPETSSLVAMEALACGTPVVALRSGALPEIVEHGLTGFLADDVEGLAEGIRRAPSISPEACRAAARARFSSEVMVAAYLDIYRRIAGVRVRPPDPADALLVEEVRSLAALEALRPEWRALWAASPQATPFQSPDWLIPWWRHLGEGELLSFAFRTPEGALAGVAPLYVYMAADGRRSLFPVGIGTTDYLDVVALPSHRDAVVAVLSARLGGDAHRFHVCEWPQLRNGAALLDVTVPAGWHEEAGDGDPCPVLRLAGGVDRLGETVPAETLESLERRRHRAGKKGVLRGENAAEGGAAPLLEAHLRLHGARWEKRGEPGVLAADPVQAMHREALPHLLESGILRLYALRLDGRVIATLQALADPPGRAERRAYFYLGGFDPAFERLSPGMLVVGHAIEEAAREGFAAVDFLRGQEGHKYRWGAVDSATRRRMLRR
ncbi:GNAT family N-acetyltransferase [Roseomonas sp. CCTCC AB2023176]|uniref:GNAT family N-acetyltransferase n=1 Tax=Roseomonas sp. CCTCC AB2023176 TaxID=3342640 RepID=UPI0035D90234